MLKRIDARNATHASDAPAAADSPEEGLPKKILVAEDDVVSQQAAKNYLEAIGCTVVLVENGAAAVDACARRDFGLVLMDLQMPKMDGLKAAKEIRRQERPGRHVPILALTAKSASDELAKCIAAGMNGLLTKPLDMARLRQTLDRFGLARRALHLPEAHGSTAVSEPLDLMTLKAKFSADAAALRGLCHTFITSTTHQLEELDSAVSMGERMRVRLLTHKIKVGGSGVYAHRLAAIAAQIESEAMTATLAQIAAATDSLRRAFDEVALHIGSSLS